MADGVTIPKMKYLAQEVKRRGSREYRYWYFRTKHGRKVLGRAEDDPKKILMAYEECMAKLRVGGEAEPWGCAIEAVMEEGIRRVRKRALRYQVPFDLTIDWVRDRWNAQGGRCLVSRLAFNIRGRRNACLPSFDRIVPREGYTQKNTRLVVFAVNVARNSFGDDDYLRVCKAVVMHNPDGIGQ